MATDGQSSRQARYLAVVCAVLATLFGGLSACGGRQRGPSEDEVHAVYRAMGEAEAELDRAVAARTGADSVCAAAARVCDAASPLHDTTAGVDADTRCARARAVCRDHAEGE